ncbi:MAG: hypothetical protein JHC38_02795 [Thiotrichales bacterium]|jgi:hypothetical protein|nr:hypothetical protein [Thiotrichales bacterium]
MELYPFTAGNQIKTYISQIMRVFSGFQYDKGDGTLGRIPLVYGGMQRVVAGVLSSTGNIHQAQRAPIMALNMSGIELLAEGKRSPLHEEYVPNLAVDPTARTAASRIIGPSFQLGIELGVYASSITELFEIVEQILLIFNPRVTINVDTTVASGAYLTEISLVSIEPEISYPLGQDASVAMITLNFSVPIRLRYPHGNDDIIIKSITSNVMSSDGGEVDLTGKIETKGP